jgi:hypothetical protein
MQGDSVWQTRTDRDIDKVMKILLGNGTPGIMGRIATVENDVVAIREEMKRRTRKWDRIEAGVWIGVTMMVLTFLMEHVK